MVYKTKILLAEDNDGLRYLMINVLQEAGYLVSAVSCGEELLEQYPEIQPDLLLLDYKLPDMKITQVLDELDERNSKVPFIIVTGHGDEKIAVEMMKRGAVDYIIKDFKLLDVLPEIIKRVLNELNMKEKLLNTERELNDALAYYELLSKNIADVIWTMDLNQKFTFFSPSCIKLLGYTPEELIDASLMQMLDSEDSGKIQALFDSFIDTVKADPFDLTNKRIKTLELNVIRKDNTRIWTESQISTLIDTERIIGLSGVTRDIQIRKETELKLKESYDTLYRALVSCINAMGKTTEIRDPYTAGHQKKVSKLAYKIAKEMKLSSEICDYIKMAGEVHDIGKIRIPAEILSKPGSISANEFKIIQTHPVVGYEILHTVEFPWPIAEIVLQHHERLNGSGYPHGIKGDKMLLETKIIGVADVVEAMASHRPYRPALGIEKAIEEIKMNKGILYDEQVVECCINVITREKEIFE